MGAAKWIRASAVIMILMCVAHAIGHYQGIGRLEATTDARELALLEALKGFELPDVPTNKTFFTLYVGFSLSFSLFSLLSGLLVWLAAGFAGSDRKSMLQLCLLWCVLLAILTAVSLKYFILPPTTFYVVALALALVALVKAWRMPAPR